MSIARCPLGAVSMRLDAALFKRGVTTSRSQAENYIKLGLVRINGGVAKKASRQVNDRDVISVEGDQYVSRAALKLASVVKQFELDFRGKTVLDVGSSTGGFTDYALQHGADKIYAVDVGTDQLHPSLRSDKRIILHEKTDIRNVCLQQTGTQKMENEKGDKTVFIDSTPDIVLADVSFISLTQVLPAISSLTSQSSILVMMCKPQFEAGRNQTTKGVVKNNAVRRGILREFENWLQSNKFIILDKADSQVAGTKGNVERFYKLRKV